MTKTIASVSLFATLSLLGIACTQANAPAPTGSEEPAADSKQSADNKTTTSTPAASSSSQTTASTANDAGTTTSTGTDNGGSGGGGASCSTLNGSCKTSASACNEYYGGASGTKDIQKQTCAQLNGTWSDDPCDTTGSVGGCKQEETVGNICGGAISWFYAPITADNLATACPAPGVVVQPGDE